MSNIINSIVRGFASAKEDANHYVVFTTTTVVDEFTGLNKIVKRAYICLNSFYFKDYMNKECTLVLEYSDKLKKHICVDIKVKEDK